MTVAPVGHAQALAQVAIERQQGVEQRLETVGVRDPSPRATQPARSRTGVRRGSCSCSRARGNVRRAGTRGRSCRSSTPRRTRSLLPAGPDRVRRAPQQASRRRRMRCRLEDEVEFHFRARSSRVAANADRRSDGTPGSSVASSVDCMRERRDLQATSASGDSSPMPARRASRRQATHQVVLREPSAGRARAARRSRAARCRTRRLARRLKHGELRMDRFALRSPA